MDTLTVSIMITLIVIMIGIGYFMGNGKPSGFSALVAQYTNSLEGRVLQPDVLPRLLLLPHRGEAR
jgi:uncharacterized membrane protein